MRPGTPATLKWLAIVSAAYVILSLIAGIVAVQANLPAQPMGEGSGSGKPVLQDFLFGGGTAMSPGVPWLLAQVILTVLAFQRKWWGSIGVWGLIVFGLLFAVFSFTEPTARGILGHPTADPPKAVIEAGIVVLPVVLVVLGFLELNRRRQGR